MTYFEKYLSAEDFLPVKVVNIYTGFLDLTLAVVL